MFENLPMAPEDPILGLTDEFYADPRSNKINLGIGVYNDEKTIAPILTSVKQAEKLILEKEQTKNYLSIEGSTEFAFHTQILLFGKDSEVISTKRARTAQTPGGTGALSIIADFLVKKSTINRIWISNPTWPNHNNIFSTAGLNVKEYPWYNQQTHLLDFDNLLLTLQKEVQPGDAVLFHGCCHNPTGVDPTIEQWKQLANLSQMNHWIPIFDFAYQGFSKSLEEDTKALRMFVEHHQEMIVASSYSKNMGLYNERVGSLTVIGKNSQIVNAMFSQIKTLIRVHYSNPPAHGAAIVTTILKHKDLKLLWHQELFNMRERICKMRQLFVHTLQQQGIKKDFNFINKQHGMFSYSGLNKQQVIFLRKHFGIYIVDSGRINIASITLTNINYLCKAISSVIKSNIM
ncbi:MAG: amino acid aminotransferase [Candidatus Dasytiphilus stammeri]